jgi:hypothetical protein
MRSRESVCLKRREIYERQANLGQINDARLGFEFGVVKGSGRHDG